MKEVILTQGYKALIDDDDEWLVSHYKWWVIKSKCTNYAQTEIKGKAISLHRFIMNLSSTKMEVDHIDHNGLNNQKSNLRILTHQQNLMNRQKNPNTISKYKGVTKQKNRNKWRAMITFNYKRIILGYFNTEEAAALAYNLKAKELFKEFAYLNKI